MAAKKKIIIYTSPSCQPCARLKTYLEYRKFDYEALGIKEAANEGYRSVPIIKVDDEVIVGFGEEEQKKLKELLEND